MDADSHANLLCPSHKPDEKTAHQINQRKLRFNSSSESEAATPTIHIFRPQVLSTPRQNSELQELHFILETGESLVNENQ